MKEKPGRKYPDAIVEAIKVWLKLMQDHGIIQPSLSKASSPLLVVKQDGKYRSTCDNTEVNNSINTIHGAIPSLDIIVRWLSTKRYKSVLDLLKDYFQAPADKRMRQMYAFSTPFGRKSGGRKEFNESKTERNKTRLRW